MNKLNAETLIPIILSAISAILIFIAERKIDKKSKDGCEKEENNQKFFLIMLKMSNASISLAEATAKAVQRIPDAHCNGDMHSSLEYAKQIKNELKDFMYEQGIHNINE